MDGSVSLGRRERKRLLELYRGGGESSVRLRAHVVLLLADGHAWSVIAAMLYCSTRTIARWKRRFEEGGVEALVAGGWTRMPRRAGKTNNDKAMTNGHWLSQIDSGDVASDGRSVGEP